MGRCIICDNKTENYIYICKEEKEKVFKIFWNHKTEKNKYNNISKENENLQKLLQEKINELNIIRHEMNQKEIKFKEFYKNFEGNKKNANEFYDTILNINSILDVNKGWEIKFNSKKGKEEYDKMVKEDILKVGVIGNGNKGKSFFLSKISDYELPTGTSIRTEGLSLKFPDNSNKKIILMDSAGFETPLLDNNNIRSLEKENYLKELENTARDRLVTEKFLQNFIVCESDILICVIGILTYSEQKLINRIKNDIFKYKNKKLYIIHNLQTFTEKKQVEDYINDFLKKSLTFEVKENDVKSFDGNKSRNNIYYYENKKFESNFFSRDLETYHFIIANDNSEAGDYYNQFVFKYFKDLYKTIIHMSPFPLTEKLMKYFESFSSLITDNKISRDDFEIKNEENQENQENQENEENQENNFNIINENNNNDINEVNNLNNNNLILKLKNKQNITMKKCFTDELGINNFISLEYIPKYICYIEDKSNIKNENEDKPKTENSNKSKHLVILIEIPGTINELNYDLKLIDNNYKLNITGKKMLSKKLKIKNENILSSSIEEGNFSLNILIPHDEEKNIILANEKEITDFSKTKDGYLKITCDLYEKKKQKIIINNDDDDED